MSEHDDEYRRFDEDMRLIEQFHEKINDPGQPLGGLVQEYLEQVRPADQRVTAQIGRWSAQLETDPAPEPPPAAPEPAEEPPPDDVPF